MLFGPDGLPIGLGKSAEVDEGVAFLREQVHAGQTTFYVARAVGGFALLVGSPHRVSLGAGIAIGVSLTAVNLAALRNRVFELLGAPVVESRLGGSDTALTEPQTDEVSDGLRYLGEQIGQGRAAFYLGRRVGGYALLVGSVKCFDVGPGVGIGVALSESGLRLLRNRVVELLHGGDISRRLEKSDN